LSALFPRIRTVIADAGHQSRKLLPWSMTKDGRYESSGGDSVRSKSRV
jgi:hypothetical protein